MRTGAVILGTWVTLAGCHPSGQAEAEWRKALLQGIRSNVAHLNDLAYYATAADLRCVDASGNVTIPAVFPQPMLEGCLVAAVPPDMLITLGREAGSPIWAVHLQDGSIGFLGRTDCPTLACAAVGASLYMLGGDSTLRRFDMTSQSTDATLSLSLPGAFLLQPYTDGSLLAASMSDLIYIDVVEGTFTSVGDLRLSAYGDFAVSPAGRIDYPCLETQSVVTARLEGGALLVERTTPLPIQWTDTQLIAIAHPIGWLVVVIVDVAFIRRDD